MTREEYFWINDGVNKMPNHLIEHHNNCINQIFDEHEKELKQSYIDGSNSNNKLIQFYLKTIEVKDKKIEILTSMLKDKK